MRHQPTVFKTLDLPGGTLMPFSSVPGERVRVVCGRVWLTEEGNPNDVFLGHGEEVALGTHGIVVLEALGAARVQLIEQTPMSNVVLKAAQQLARRLATWWARHFRQPTVVNVAEF